MKVWTIAVGAGVAILTSNALAQTRAPARTPTRTELPGLEKLNRGVVALQTATFTDFVSWRLFGTEPSETAFNLYVIQGSSAPVKVNSSPITDSTNYINYDVDVSKTRTYYVRAIRNNVELESSEQFTVKPTGNPLPYLSVPLQIPPGGTEPGVPTTADPNPAPHTFVYSACDCSVGDVDGDGQYEIIVKWDPSDSKDNSQSGYTGNVILDCYRLDGTRLWRIDLGRNIRAGAHYTQFMVYDFDGDGKAEMMCKTADGTIDGVGTVIGNANADFRNSAGYVLSGGEFLTVFDGMTGKALATTNYVPPRYPSTLTPTPTQINQVWGDNYGNRVDRFLAGVAYLDGMRPSAIFARGYYTRTCLTAWDWRNGKLTQRWAFDTRVSSNPVSGNYAAGYNATWEEMGNHQLSVADVDGDGKDEILYGSIAVDDNGKGMYTTTLAHGDAYHVSDMDPDRPGLEVFEPHENPSKYGSYGIEMHDARTGAIIWGATGDNSDVGRGCAMDIDPRYRGYEAWGARPLAGGTYSCKGQVITLKRPSMNFGVWWDGDLLRELLDGNHIGKWDWINSAENRVLTATECTSNNSTKATPCLSGDILGDWREEVVWRTIDSSALHIYTTTAITHYKLYTLMHDRQYREAIAWQNTAYNQPPHPSFYLGDGMTLPLKPLLTTP